MRPAWVPAPRDALLAAAVSALAVLELVAGPNRSDATATATALGLTATSALAWRVRVPLAASLVSCAAFAVIPLATVPLEFFVVGVVALLVAPYTVVARSRDRFTAIVGGVLVLVLVALQGVWDDRFGSVGAALANVVFALLAMGVGVLVRQVEQRSRYRLAQQQAAAESNVRALRAEIARDLHDVVAHALSVVAVQAGGARAVLHDEPARAGQALEDIQDVTRRALVDMRHLLDLTRDGGPAEDAVRRPGLDRLEELVEPLERSGIAVRLQQEGEPVTVSPGTETTAVRVVQEALTNVLRHSRARTACVGVCWRYDGLELSVADDGVGGPEAPGGHGLVGMRERVDLLGGRLDAGPRPDGGWAVTALLPLPTPGTA